MHGLLWDQMETMGAIYCMYGYMIQEDGLLTIAYIMILSSTKAVIVAKCCVWVLAEIIGKYVHEVYVILWSLRKNVLYMIKNYLFLLILWYYGTTSVCDYMYIALWSPGRTFLWRGLSWHYSTTSYGNKNMIIRMKW